ncbi:MAG: hypothetical protein ACREE4_11965 [Stellaceae bacterium]
MDEGGRPQEETGQHAPARPPAPTRKGAAPADEEAARMRAETDREFVAWLRFWVQLAILAALTIGGAFYASQSDQPGGYQCGLVLAIVAFLLILALVKRRLDGAPGDLASTLLVNDTNGLSVVVPLLAAAAIGGLVLAANDPPGPLYIFGLALFGASVLAILWQIKHVYDRTDRGES